MRADEATPFDVAQDRPFDRLRTDSAQVGLPLVLSVARRAKSKHAQHEREAVGPERQAQRV